MNLKQLLVVAALVVTGVTWSLGDTGVAAPKKPALLKKATSEGPVDRQLEVRLGPRVSFLTGDARVGKNGTDFDIWDDLKLDDPNAGIQFDIDYQPWNRWHFTYDMSWDRYDQSATTQKNISKGNGETLLSGANISGTFDAFVFEGTVGYEVIKTDLYRLRPYIGGIGGYVSGSYTISGNTNVGNPVVLGTINRSDNVSTSYGSFIGGIDQRLYASRSWYLGGDIGAFGWDNWYLVTGDAYTGYDFSKSFGIRLGYKADYVNWENGPKAGKAEPLLGAVYVQGIWGF